MKEVKAYVRPELAEKVITELEISGLNGMTVIDVSLLGSWADARQSRLSMEYCERYCSCTKIEFVCGDEELDKFVDIVIDKAHTGRKGDGKIFITDIYDAVSIRTKEHGIKSL